ncbi:MAG: hypothetical protein HOD97_04180 [Candidatus Marinimicrobia bacterium]|jgi:hypothetical protein|nr:hypothetical protein [Candidatus Neomarinimicrobiota bacterium]MBT3617917.1 hypothetical protein [Candidatus Neomarinimicrobiota bacterium]MBT3828754.1 hypothetical protein [Candidatus Neomarinimicrobiota bacterium]MBT3997045.1 hypothetical protein [Candidatus Neomarinimicrobiota bacterium]MBT4280801.1 hypothetical protein [Candidatus Neomarinimicrobiota bacterium]
MNRFLKISPAFLIVMFFSGCALFIPNHFAENEITFENPNSPAKPLPRGWSVGENLMAEWGSGVNEILGNLPDTTLEVEYWKDEIDIETGKRLPILKARVRFDYKTRLNTQRVELRFVNVDYIYDMDKISSEHYQLESVTKTIELTTTGYPKILVDDVLRKKVLMVYGTPQSFNGLSHAYTDENTMMKVRVLDNSHLMITLNGYQISNALQDALYKVYSEDGIDLKKEQILQEFEL